MNPAPYVCAEESETEDPIQKIFRQLGKLNVANSPAPAPSDSLWGAPGNDVVSSSVFTPVR